MEDKSDHLEALVEKLIESGDRLPADIRIRLLASGAEAVPALIRVLEDEELALSTARGGGYAPVHAAELLGELRAPEAVEPMLRLLSRTDFMDVLHDRLLTAMPAIGAPVVEPALRAASEARGDARDSFIAVLADAGVHDDRILDLLLDQLRRDPTHAGNIAAYGDPRALPALYRAFDSFRIEPGESIFGNQALVEIRDAIEELGGTLTAEQKAKYRVAREPAERFRRALLAALQAEPKGELDGEPAVPAAPPFRPGRNYPCWCGSGRKYKKCHLDADEGRGPVRGSTA